MLEESIPDNSGRWIHYGLTSSDILDTSLVLMCQESLQVIVEYISSTCYHLNKLMKLKENLEHIRVMLNIFFINN